MHCSTRLPLLLRDALWRVFRIHVADGFVAFYWELHLASLEPTLNVECFSAYLRLEPHALPLILGDSVSHTHVAPVFVKGDNAFVTVAEARDDVAGLEGFAVVLK